MAARTDSMIITSDNNDIGTASDINSPTESDGGVSVGGQRALGDVKGISPGDDAKKIDSTIVCRDTKGSVRDDG
jgi:hypothetical protein